MGSGLTYGYLLRFHPIVINPLLDPGCPKFAADAIGRWLDGIRIVPGGQIGQGPAFRFQSKCPYVKPDPGVAR